MSLKSIKLPFREEPPQVFPSLWGLVAAIVLLIWFVSPSFWTAINNERLIFSFDSDEATHVRLLRDALINQSLNFNFHGYGHLFFNVAYVIARGTELLLGPVADQTLIQILRAVSLSGGIFCLLAVFFLARRFFGAWQAGLAPLFLVIFCAEFRAYSGISHPDTLQLALTVLTLFWCLSALDRKNLFFTLVTATIFAGLTFVTKYSGLFLLPIIFLCAWSRRGELPTWRFIVPGTRLVLAVLGLCGVVVSVTLGWHLSAETILNFFKPGDALTPNEQHIFNLLHLGLKVVIVPGLAFAGASLWNPQGRAPAAAVYRFMGIAILLSAIFILTIPLFSPYLLVHGRLLKGMLAESLHVSFGHGFKVHSSAFEWFTILYSPFGIGSLSSLLLLFSLMGEQFWKKRPLPGFSPQQILWIWILGYFSYLFFKVNYREARYLLPLVPACFLLASDLLAKILNQGGLRRSFCALGIFVILLSQIPQLKAERQRLANREANSVALTFALKNLSGVPKESRIGFDAFVYVPPEFQKAYFEWRWSEARMKELQIEYFILNQDVAAQYKDPSRAVDFYWGEARFMEVHHFYKRLESGALGFQEISRSKNLILYQRTAMSEGTPQPKNSSIPEASTLDNSALDTRLSQQIERILSSRDFSSPESLCDAQYVLMLPALAAFSLNLPESKQVFWFYLKRALSQTRTLEQIRLAHVKRSYRVDPFLLDVTQSGPDQRRIFPFVQNRIMFRVPHTKTGIPVAEVTEQPLCQLQFSYLLSFVMRLTSAESKTTPDSIQFLNEAYSFLLNDLVIPYWTSVAAWHWQGFFPNMREAVIARLDFIHHKNLISPTYYRAFYDMDFFTMAIAADLLAAKKIFALSKEQETQLYDIQSLTRRMFEARLEPGLGFLFQKGIWTEHQEYQYALCEIGQSLPDTPCPDPQQAPDSNHAERLPWWLLSFESSFEPDSEGAKYYQHLQKRLAHQLAESVLDWSAQFPRLTNFMDGKNGWYRVRYNGRNWGYGPFALSHAAKWFSWSPLGKFDNRITQFHDKLCNLIHTKDRASIAFRTAYYGNPVQPKLYGLGTEDDIGTNPLYPLYCDLWTRLTFLR